MYFYSVVLFAVEHRNDHDVTELEEFDDTELREFSHFTQVVQIYYLGRGGN